MTLGKLRAKMGAAQISDHGNLNDAVRRYGLATLAAIVALWLRQLLSPLFRESNPYHTIWSAVVFSAWYCGLGPSMLTASIGLVGVWYWFLPPYNSFNLEDPKTEIPGMLGFLIL
jgi:K+-sensing histidine kinase KdpD